MSAIQRAKNVIPLAAVLVLWGAVFSMACRLTLAPPSDRTGDLSVAGQVFGASRMAFSSSFFTEADNYFHLGVGHVSKKAITNDFIQTWHAAIQPSGHAHAEGKSVREIMPWLEFAIRANPHNVDAYLTAAYWLGMAGRSDLAERVLMQGQQSNPRDHRILLERARLLLDRHEDVRAALLLDEGLRAWPGKEDPQDDQALLDLTSLLSYRAFLHELKGDRQAALVLFRKALEASPGNPGLAKRVRAIESGEDFSEEDRAVWNTIFGRNKSCAREGDPDHEHDHDDHELN